MKVINTISQSPRTQSEQSQRLQNGARKGRVKKPNRTGDEAQASTNACSTIDVGIALHAITYAIEQNQRRFIDNEIDEYRKGSQLKGLTTSIDLLANYLMRLGLDAIEMLERRER